MYCMGQSYGSIHKLKGLPLPNTQSAFRAKPHQGHRSTLEKGTREGHRPCDVISFGEVKVPRVLSLHGRERTLGTTWDPLFQRERILGTRLCEVYIFGNQLALIEGKELGKHTSESGKSNLTS